MGMQRKNANVGNKLPNGSGFKCLEGVEVCGKMEMKKVKKLAKRLSILSMSSTWST